MRGSKLSRAVQWFREGDLDEVRVAFTLVKEIVEVRLLKANPTIIKAAKRMRKAKVKAAEPVQEAVAS